MGFEAAESELLDGLAPGTACGSPSGGTASAWSWSRIEKRRAP